MERRRSVEARRKAVAVAELNGGEFALLAGLVFHNVSRDRAGGHGQRAGKIHLPRAAASWEIPVLRADDDLIRPRGNARTRIDAGAATRLDDVRSRPLENLQIAAPDAIIPRFLRAELNVKLDGVGNPFALP